MTNKTKTILCVCALTASTFAWNAMADDEVNYGIHYNNEIYGGAWHIQHHPTEPFGDTGNEDRTTLFSALSDNSVLSFAIERNDTQNGFTFGTYTVDSNGNINRQTLGSVTDTGEVGKNNVEKIQIKNENGDLVDSIDSGTFNANDLVGVWVQETGKAPIYYSNNILTRDNNTSLPVDSEGNPVRDSSGELLHFTEGFNEDGNGSGSATLWFDDATTVIPALNEWNPEKYEYYWPGEDREGNPAFIKIHVTGYAPVTPAGTTGGPLPGVWATIALAGAASAYLKRRRKENK